MTQVTRQHVACTRCIMTLADSALLEFDDQGVCNLCRTFDTAFAAVPRTWTDAEPELNRTVERLKAAGKGKPYDCLIGLSGGVDSSYIAYLMKRYDLRPLAVHFDNGWNTELAVENIDRIVTRLDIDLVTYVIDWDDFRELQLAYLRAGVIDIEVLTDHAIFGALYDIAMRNRIKHIISGVNVATEHFMPDGWNHEKYDAYNIMDIYRKHGGARKLSNYPLLDRRKWRKFMRSGIEQIQILNMIPYNAAEARETIERELGWRPYTGKHHESIFTRFYQGYLLPRKFGVDKRKAHLSNLVCSGQMTRDEALREFQQEIYSPSEQREDLEFVCKKLQVSAEEFEGFMRAPPRRHLDFENHKWFFARYPIFKPLLPLWRLYKRRTA